MQRNRRKKWNRCVGGGAGLRSPPISRWVASSVTHPDARLPAPPTPSGPPAPCSSAPSPTQPAGACCRPFPPHSGKQHKKDRSRRVKGHSEWVFRVTFKESEGQRPGGETEPPCFSGVQVSGVALLLSCPDDPLPLRAGGSSRVSAKHEHTHNECVAPQPPSKRVKRYKVSG